MTTTVILLTDIQGLLFDLDGTLISTLSVTEQIYRDLAHQHKIDPQPVIDFCHEYAKELELQAVDQLSGLTVIDGARELVNGLKKGTWAIFTSGLPMLAVPRMQYLGVPVPEVLVTPVDVDKGKPFADGYLLAAKKIGKNVARCLVFEDAEAGIVSGVRAGALVIGIRTLLDHSTLCNAGATYTVKDMTKVRVIYTETGSMTVEIDQSD
ncbi:hypothetical protein FB645_003824 [Coemansia sp. IMI 203386]|nr:hypothetical protein FB645_003824 [Coemansia sp. IMI 203386]